MALIFGVNFRSTSTYVTDGANQTYALLTDTYPTTRGGVTFGWETTPGLDSRDRSTGVDVRLAGLHFHGNSDTNTDTFRLDLPNTGIFRVRLACGDAGGNPQTNYLIVKDSSTAFITFAPLATSSSEFGDAAGNKWSSANWPGSNVSVDRTFTSTILRVTIGGAIDSASSTIVHLSVEELTTSTGPSLFRGRNFSFFDDDQVNRFEFWPAQAPSSDVTLALTGVSAASSVGSLTPTRNVALTGQSATGSIGTVSPNVSVAVSGNSATASAGSVTPGLNVGLTGSAGTTSLGTLAPNRTVSLSGNQATSAVGTVTPIIGVTVALTGVSATTSVGTLGTSRTTALTGVSASSSVGTVTPSIGVNVALTGVQATTSVGILSPSISRGLTGSSATASVGTVIADRSVGIAGVTSTATVGSLGTTRTVSITGVEALASVGTILPGTDDALAVSRNVGSAVLFTTHVGTGVLRTSDVGTMTLTTSNVGATSIVYQDVRSDT